jgi:hypothetical protein
MPSIALSRWSGRLFLVLVALLPLHTVYLRLEVAWKPWLVLVVVIAVLDLLVARSLPWDRGVTVGVAVFLASVLGSWPGWQAGVTFWRLWLALGAGALLLLVSSRHLRDLDAVLRVAFWTGLVMAATGLLLGLVTNGVFGEAAVDAVNDIWGIDRVNKPAYLGSGFIALTNWHQDPGYAALWANVWLILSAFAWERGAVRGPRWLGPLVLGGLATLTLLTLSRTGWLGLLVALAAITFCRFKEGSEALRRWLATLLAATAVAVALIGLLVLTDPRGVGGDLATALDFRFSHLFALGAIDIGVVGEIDPDRIVGDNRLEVWAEYWSRFLDSPIRGIGLGTGWAQTGFQEPHNIWLQLLAETGVIGLLGFLFLVGSIASLRTGPGAVGGSVLAVVGFAGLSQTVIFEPVLWLSLALWLAHALKREAERPSFSVT